MTGTKEQMSAKKSEHWEKKKQQATPADTTKELHSRGRQYSL